jgi:predicted phosphodiesterase
MRLLLLSDLHLEVAPLELPDPGVVDVVLLAGDIASPAAAVADWVRASPVLRRARAVLWVPGNHEYFDAAIGAEAAAMRAAAAGVAAPPLQLLDGDAVVIGGVRFVGCTLWTDFELRIDTPQGMVSDRARGIAASQQVMVDYRAIAWDQEAAPRRLTPLDTLQLHRAQRAWLHDTLRTPFAGPTVVVTHHGPHRGSLAPRYAADWVSTAYLSELPPEFFEAPVLWVHGHTHTSRDYRVGGCRVVCNPRGYAPPGRRPENPMFDPAFVVDLADRAAPA